MQTAFVSNPTFTQWLKWKIATGRYSPAVERIEALRHARKVKTPWPSRARIYSTLAVWLRQNGFEAKMPLLANAFKEYEAHLISGGAIPASRPKGDGIERIRRSFTILPETYDLVRELCDAFDPPISQGAVIDKAIASLHARKFERV